MGYYTAAGDYARRGGYYRGDGFWSSLGSGLKSVASFGRQLLPAAGAIIGGPIGGAVGALAAKSPIPGILDMAGAAASHNSTAGAGASAAATQLPSIPSSALASHVSSMPGAGHPAALATRGALTAHMHISKRTGQMVKGRRPRMNPLNVKALRRGIRRAHAFARIARSVVTFAKHGAHGTKFKAHFGHKRKRLHA